MEPQEHFPSLRGRIKADAAIIGGGLSGLSIALCLAKAGLKVAVAESSRLGAGATGCCAGIVSLSKGSEYTRLEAEQGITVTDAYVQTQKSAINAIHKICKDGKLAWKEVPFSLLESNLSECPQLRAETEAMKRAGIPSLTLEEQSRTEWAQIAFLINANEYFAVMIREAKRYGVCIREDSRVTGIDADTIYTDHGSIRAPYLIVASGFPLINMPGLFFLRMEQHRAWQLQTSYPFSGCLSTLDGRCAVRETESGSAFSVFGEKIGRDEACQKAWLLVPEAEKSLLSIQNGMECFTMDGLPFIGVYSRRTPNLFVSSGYGGKGLLGSMMGAQAISARILGLPSEGYEIYSPQRKWKAGMTFSIAGRYLQGMLCRNAAPKCPHMGCRMIYHQENRSWECPCHGSCFDDIGHILNGPAVTDAHVSGKKKV